MAQNTTAIRCRHCDGKISVPASRANRAWRCPHCGFVTPGPGWECWAVDRLASKLNSLAVAVGIIMLLALLTTGMQCIAALDLVTRTAR